MKGILSIAALAALAACNQSAPGVEKAKADAPPPAATAPHSNAAPGRYTRINADGSMVITQLEADGSYTDWVAGAMTESGKWAVKDNKTCFHPEKGDERCGSDGPIQADGSYTVTPDSGASYTMRKIA